MGGIDLEQTSRVADARVVARIDRLLPARDAFDELGFVAVVDGNRFQQLPIALASPAARDQRLHILVAAAELVDVLAEADVRRPFAELDAARHVDRGHWVSPAWAPAGATAGANARPIDPARRAPPPPVPRRGGRGG